MGHRTDRRVFVTGRGLTEIALYVERLPEKRVMRELRAASKVMVRRKARGGAQFPVDTLYHASPMTTRIAD
jgi:hypothetical protein